MIDQEFEEEAQRIIPSKFSQFQTDFTGGIRLQFNAHSVSVKQILPCILGSKIPAIGGCFDWGVR